MVSAAKAISVATESEAILLGAAPEAIVRQAPHWRIPNSIPGDKLHRFAQALHPMPEGVFAMLKLIPVLFAFRPCLTFEQVGIADKSSGVDVRPNMVAGPNPIETRTVDVPCLDKALEPSSPMEINRLAEANEHIAFDPVRDVDVSREIPSGIVCSREKPALVSKQIAAPSSEHWINVTAVANDHGVMLDSRSILRVSRQKSVC